ncbi:MAG TPA: hypothetical protein VML36_04935 [Nitrospiria bacterium]|nr:hypothetical protein [Nitrospiria bacterium]
MTAARAQGLLLAIISLLPVSCATAPPADPALELRQTEFLKGANREAFERVEPTLRRLQAGQPMDESGLRWSANEVVTNTGKPIGMIVWGDGWIPALSGGISGALSKFGALSGRDGDIIYGQHAYGFVWGGMDVMPKYVVTTEAELCRREDYDRLSAGHTGNIGRLEGEDNTPIYFKNLRIAGVRETDFPEPSAISPLHLEQLTSSAYRRFYLGPESFHAIEPQLRGLTPGTPMLEVVRSLGGVPVSAYGGEQIVFMGMRGFLNVSSRYQWSRWRADGLFAVWPFGYLDGGREVPKLAVLFRNGLVLKVVPYGSRAELERQFEE